MPNYYVIDEANYWLLRDAIFFLKGYLSVGKQSEASLAKIREAANILDELERK